MEITTFAAPEAFKTRAFAFLRENEAENCLGLGILDTLITKPEIYPKAYLWAVSDGRAVVGAAWMTPPHPIGLTAMPDAALALVVDAAAKVADRPPSVVGPKATSDRFRDLWTEKTGVGLASTMEQRIYQATAITPARPVPGQMRLAGETDRPLLEAWNLAFSVDCGQGNDLAKAMATADAAIKMRSRYLWVVDGKPVCMTGVGGPTPSGIRVSWVYTPPERRGHGYASALVGAVSQKMLDDGKSFCFLYTDLANPTSNSIYQKLGYRPVCDSVHHTFAGGH